ncbi:hypothetical protein BFJ66_g17416 [Fusarium oxysporum f. sp. cepae]|nr:hypothetical protein BFJ67_g17360 [Fusarium oxysporum f. sp. cepae]RKK23659.1 hypothetical protein BFJ66_g17416 [Fusarium oxysporum f. sp. cepae]
MSPPKVAPKPQDEPVFHPVVIIGAGCGGIGMACELKNKLGFEDVHIFERRSGVGGTWWSNRYPGVACDIRVLLLFVPTKSKLDNLLPIRS